MGDRHFAMVSEWMDHGNINEFIKVNRDVNRFELVSCPRCWLHLTFIRLPIARRRHQRVDIYARSSDDTWRSERGMVSSVDCCVHSSVMSFSLKANILVDESGHARIADFGLLTIVSDPVYSAASSSVMNAGTIRWMSPELLYPEHFNLKESRPTNASDCYALGMVMLEVLSGRAPYGQFKEFIVMRMLLEGTHPERPEMPWFTNDLWRILEQCWSQQPEDRPTLEAILEYLGQVATTWEPLPPGVEDNNEIADDESVSTVSHYRMFRYFIFNPAVRLPYRSDSLGIPRTRCQRSRYRASATW